MDSSVRTGDIIRVELEEDGTWFYCRVHALDGADDVLFSVVDAQSWPNVALSGYLPGREYRLPVARVLSVVRRAA
jgi:hypothetical protein